MEALFLKILNMSITASWLVLAVLASRFLLKKAPKAFSVILWGLVGIRLILPFSLESVLSLVPSAETVPGDIVYSASPEINSGIAFLNSAVNPLISETLAPNQGGVATAEIVALIASVVWVSGMVAMLLYTVVSFLRFKSKVREAAPFNENIYLCDGIGTPFILGVVRSRIYLPSAISEADMEYVIAHERAHLKRRDHLWKPLGFLLLTVYWFNPVLWIAYILLCRDIELACDEKVIRDRGVEIKKSYSEALVNCSVPRKMIAACPLAFGEGSVKGRIKSVLNYKKPAFWIIIVSIIACVAVAACFLTNPISKSKIPENFIVIDSGSELEGISISVKEAVLDTGKPYIKIEWENKSEDMPDILLADELPFDIQYYDDDKGDFISCGQPDAAELGAHFILTPGKTETRTYYLTGFDLTKEGTYRFIIPASFGYSSQFPTGYVWIDFKIKAPSGEYDATWPGIVSTIEPAGVQTDLNHNGIMETPLIGTYRNESGALEWMSITVPEEGKEDIFTENAYTTHAGDDALFLCRMDGKDYILRYSPYMLQGYATYRYQLFYIAENGAEVVIQENSVTFDNNFGFSVHQGFEPEDINAFLTEVNALLADSVELINTDDELIESFKNEGRLYHTPQFLFGEDRGFNYDYDKSLLENLEEYKSAVIAFYAESDNG